MPKRPQPSRRQPLSSLLKASLRQARSLAVVGIGSDLRGDDIAGLLVLRELQAALPRSKQVRPRDCGMTSYSRSGILPLSSKATRLEAASTMPERIRLFDGGTAPENLTGEIARFCPSHILLVDAADLGLKPGEATLLEPEAIEGVSFSTHVLPLSILSDYLKRAMPCRIMILGIQPGPTAFSANHSKALDQTARRVARLILTAMPG